MPRPVTVTYRISSTPAEVATAAADLFTSAAIKASETRGLARIAISGGTTPKAMFALLADPTQPFLKQVSWDKLDLYWVDERCVPPDHADSNYRMTKEALLSKVPLPAGHIHRMEGELDPEVAAARYESTIRNSFKLEGAETPTFDLVLLGMGDDGHTASLFPHTEGLNDLTHIVTFQEHAHGTAHRAVFPQGRRRRRLIACNSCRPPHVERNKAQQGGQAWKRHCGSASRAAIQARPCAR